MAAVSIGTFVAGGGALAGRGALLNAGPLLVGFLLLRLSPVSILGLPQALEFLLHGVVSWEYRAMQAALHLSLLQDEHVAVSEVVGVAIRFILAQGLKLW